MKTQLIIGLNATIIAVTREIPRVLTVKRPEYFLALPGEVGSEDGAYLDALPFGPLDPSQDRTLELGLRRWVRDLTSIELGYVEQLYTFGDQHRDPAEHHGGARVISVAYLALVKERQLLGEGEASWNNWYAYLPWEDWRYGRPTIINREIAPALKEWVTNITDLTRRQLYQERIEITFGLNGSSWDQERVLERYELLYESGFVAERERDYSLGMQLESDVVHRNHSSLEIFEGPFLGQPMALDHRRILATALGRLRGKIKYRPVVFELLSKNFTLLHLQRLVEALSGVLLHKQNFRRLVEKAGLVEHTGKFDTSTIGRPAELFRFRRDVLRERRAPGVGLPGIIRSL